MQLCLTKHICRCTSNDTPICIGQSDGQMMGQISKTKTTNNVPDQLNSQQVIAKYNEIKQKYQVFFQKAIELEDELREHK